MRFFRWLFRFVFGKLSVNGDGNQNVLQMDKMGTLFVNKKSSWDELKGLEKEQNYS